MNLRSGTKKQSPVDSINTKILSDLPTEMKQKIFNYLTLKEVLEFRLVSKEAWRWVNDHGYLKSLLRYKLIRLNSTKSLESFMNVVGNMPFTKFRINFKLTQDPGVVQFKEKYASLIEDLSVGEICYCVEDGEYEFFQSLSSLRRLKIGGFTTDIHIVCRFDKVSNNTENELLKVPRIPSNCLQNLVELEIHELDYNNSYAYDLIHSCQNLRKLLPRPIAYEQSKTKKATCDSTFIREMVKYLTNRNKEQPLTIVFDGRLHGGVDFMEDFDLSQDFVRVVANSRVILINMNITMMANLQAQANLNRITKTEVDAFIASVKSVRRYGVVQKDKNLSFVTSLSFWWANQSPDSIHIHLNSPGHEYRMPNIRRILFSIRCNVSEIAAGQLSLLVRDMFDEFRPTVEMLVVSTELGDLSGPLRRNLFITPEHISVNFESLDVLAFSCSQFQHAEYTRLFHLLGENTKVRFLRWRVTRNYDNFTLPATILEMKCLRILNISVVACVTRSAWTNIEFADILSKMPLTEFVFKRHKDSRADDTPCLMHQVTSKGLNSLKSGQFRDTCNLCVLGVYGNCCLKKPSIRTAMKAIKRQFNK